MLVLVGLFVILITKMTNCGAPNCTNRSGVKEGLSFHRIPKKVEIQKKWLHNLKRKNIPENIFICSDHFEPNCFKRDLRAELMNTTPKKELVEDAVPTKFDHASISRKRVSSIARSNKKAKMQYVEEALIEHNQTISQNQNEVSCSTEDLIEVKEASAQNIVKTKSIRTQYREQDCIEGEDEIITKEKPLRVRIRKPKKVRTVAINTDLTFKPFY